MSILTQFVHRRKEDSLVWTYNKENGEIGFDNPPYQPQYKVYRIRLTMIDYLKDKKRNGFSLIELVMVMVILGILDLL